MEVKRMWKSGDVIRLIKDALLEVDGTLADDDSGEIYFTSSDVNHGNSEIIATFETHKGVDKSTDKYRIKVERL